MDRERYRSINAPDPLTDEDILQYKKNAKAQTLANYKDSHHGYLKKYNQKGKSQTRFCVIYRGAFFYFKDPESSKPCGVFKLEGYQANIEDNTCHSYMFKAAHQQNEECRSYSFSSASEKEQNTWIKCINDHVINHFPRSLYDEGKSDFYDYCPEEQIRSLGEQYTLKKKMDKEAELPARYSPKADEPPLPARTFTNSRDDTVTNSNINNVMTAGYVSMSSPDQVNTMTDGYVSMKSASTLDQNNTMTDHYTSMTDGYTTIDSVTTLGRKHTGHASISPPIQNNIMSEDYASMGPSCQKNIMTEEYASMNSVSEGTDKSTDDYTTMNDPGYICMTKPSHNADTTSGRAIRPVPDAPPVNSQHGGRGKLVSSISLSAESKSSQQRPIINRANTLPPAVPERVPENTKMNSLNRPAVPARIPESPIKEDSIEMYVNTSGGGKRPSLDEGYVVSRSADNNFQPAIEDIKKANHNLHNAKTPVIRPVPDAPSESRQHVRHARLTSSASLPSETIPTQKPRVVGRTNTLPDSRPAIPPPVPERIPSISAKIPSFESLHDDIIMPNSCIYTNIQKDECVNFLHPFEVGTYLLRVARDGKDAIAVLAKKDPPKVKHFIMFERSDGKKYLHQEEPKFETSQELIRHYYCNELPSTELRLIKPLSPSANEQEIYYC